MHTRQNPQLYPSAGHVTTVPTHIHHIALSRDTSRCTSIAKKTPLQSDRMPQQVATDWHHDCKHCSVETTSSQSDDIVTSNKLPSATVTDDVVTPSLPAAILLAMSWRQSYHRPLWLMMLWRQAYQQPFYWRCRDVKATTDHFDWRCRDVAFESVGQFCGKDCSSLERQIVVSDPSPERLRAGSGACWDL